jgi:hypothetical protein
MNNLSNAVENLIQSFEEIEIRLNVITRNIRPVESTEISKDSVYETKLAQDINKIYYKIQGLREGLDDLLNRIEL